VVACTVGARIGLRIPRMSTIACGVLLRLPATVHGSLEVGMSHIGEVHVFGSASLIDAIKGCCAQLVWSWKRVGQGGLGPPLVAEVGAKAVCAVRRWATRCMTWSQDC
jgi:hypothetical protein